MFAHIQVSSNFMTEYTSISQIKKDFQIDSDNLELIRDHINKIRINNHPDKTNGEFENENLKELYYKSNSAIEYIDSIKHNHSLVIVEKMTDLMKVITELIPANKQNSLEQNLDSKISFAISNFRSKLFIPKVSLTAITAVITFLFLFPNQIKDNPFLSHFINPESNTFALIWLSFLIYSGFLWIIAYSNEEKEKRKLALLKVDSVQNKIFEDFVRKECSENIFTKDKLTRFIFRNSDKNGFEERHQVIGLIINRFFGSNMITLEIAQNTAELIIARCEKNKVIEKLPSHTLSDTYEIKNYH